MPTQSSTERFDSLHLEMLGEPPEEDKDEAGQEEDNDKDGDEGCSDD